jgi:hypothetical protein
MAPLPLVCCRMHFPDSVDYVYVRTDSSSGSSQTGYSCRTCVDVAHAAISLLIVFPTCLQHLLRFPAPISGNLYSKFVSRQEPSLGPFQFNGVVSGGWEYELRRRRTDNRVDTVFVSVSVCVESRGRRGMEPEREGGRVARLFLLLL